jgi:hypothetical protein
MFPNTSRYASTKTAETTDANGRQIVYLRRRFISQPERFALLMEHLVTEGERLGNITFRYLGDPEQFWRICDANGAVRPEELTDTPGQRIRITMPEGLPATPQG